MRTRMTLVSLAALALLAGVAGCGSGNDASDGDAEPSSAPTTSQPASPEESDPADPSTPPDTEQAVITIQDFQFSGPGPVAPGSTITVQNDDSAAHSATSDDGGVHVHVEGGAATGTFTAPDQPGKSPYICKFHPEMTDTLVVK